MATVTRLRAGGTWLRSKLCGHRHGRRGSSSSGGPASPGRQMSIGPPTDFRREDITLGSDVDGNVMLVEQAREDAQNMHKASKIGGSLRQHARKVSAKFGGSGHHVFEGDL